MLILRSTDVLRIVTGSAVVNIEVLASYADYDAAQLANDRVTVDRDPTIIPTATTTTVVTSPGSGIFRNVTGCNVRNTHASSSNLVTIQHFDGSVATVLFAYTLLAGETIQFVDGVRWIVVDATGSIKFSNVSSLASQAEMEAAASLVTAVTPGRQHFHPSAAKFWVHTTGGATQVIGAAFYNVTSIADTGVGRMTVTIATDFSSANWVCCATSFTTNVTGDEGICNINAKAAGTVEIGNRIITPAFGDPNIGYDVVGFGDHA